MTGNHITEAELERYALGQLNEDQEATVEEHILLCAGCQDALQELDEFIQALQVATTRSPAVAPSWSSRLAMWLAEAFVPRRLSFAAAAVVLLVASVAVYQRSQIPGSSQAALIIVPAVRSLPSELPAATPANLDLDVRGIEDQGVMAARLVDASKNVVWTGQVEPVGLRASASIPGLPEGDYVLRLYKASAQLAEYVVRVK